MTFAEHVASLPEGVEYVYRAPKAVNPLFYHKAKCACGPTVIVLGERIGTCGGCGRVPDLVYEEASA